MLTKELVKPGDARFFLLDKKLDHYLPFLLQSKSRDLYGFLQEAVDHAIHHERYNPQFFFLVKRKFNYFQVRTGHYFSKDESHRIHIYNIFFNNNPQVIADILQEISNKMTPMFINVDYDIDINAYNIFGKQYNHLLSIQDNVICEFHNFAPVNEDNPTEMITSDIKLLFVKQTLVCKNPKEDTPDEIRSFNEDMET